MRPTVFVNGKFTAQPTTGVQRVAGQMLRALDAQINGPWVLLCPAGAVVPPLQRIQVRRLGPAGLPLHVWEQAWLPAAARRGLLLNLAGSAPACARLQACMLHDAAVFDFPQAYTWPFVAWYRWLFRRLARHAGALLTVSDFSRQRLAWHLRLNAARLAVVPNGADHLAGVEPDTLLLARLGLQGRRFLLAVASDNPSKNLAGLLAAYASLPPDPACALVIAGGRNTRVFATTTEGGDPPGVVRTGVLGDSELKALYLQATALVFPSLYEGFGLPPLEAMAEGCPVIAARATSLPEVCGDAALYVDPNSVPDMAAALARVFGEPALCQQLRSAGLLQAARFTWAKSAELLLATLPAA